MARHVADIVVMKFVRAYVCFCSIPWHCRANRRVSVPVSSALPTMSRELLVNTDWWGIRCICRNASNWTASTQQFCKHRNFLWFRWWIHCVKYGVNTACNSPLTYWNITRYCGMLNVCLLSYNISSAYSTSMSTSRPAPLVTDVSPELLTTPMPVTYQIADHSRQCSGHTLPHHQQLCRSFNQHNEGHLAVD